MADSKYNMANKHTSQAFFVEKWQEEGDLFEILREILLVWLGIVCSFGWIGEIFKLEYSGFLVFPIALLMVAAFQGILSLSGTSHHGLVYACIGIFAILFFLLPFSSTGLKGLLHDAARTMAKRGVRLLFQGEEVDSFFCRTFAILLILCLIYLWIRLCYLHPACTFPCMVLGMFLMELRFGDGTSTMWLIGSLLFIIMSMTTTMRASLFLLIPALALTILFGFFAGLQAKDGWKMRWDTFRYGEDNSNLPQGNLENAKAYHPSKDIALSLEGQTSGYYYLKGFVGTVYNNNRWIVDDTTLDDFELGIVAGHNEFLSWLHEKGCSGFNMLADQKGKEQEEEKTILIHNLGASRKYVYLPYELTTSIARIEEEKTGVSGPGESLRATGIFGKKKYRIKMVSSFAGKERVIASQGNPATGDITEYDAYEEYVNRTCLALPKGVKESLRNLLDGGGSMGMDTMAVVAKVRNWLKKHASYDENPGSIPDHQDFVQWFFEGDARGYDVQYASAAVMLFRYYGIPARYVEGYLIENVSKADGAAAHAWPEIFLPENGWVPVEVMESYQNRMPSYLPEKGKQIKSFNQNYEEEIDKDSQEEEEKADEKEQQAEEYTSTEVNSGQSEESTTAEKEKTGLQKSPLKDGKFPSHQILVIGILLIIIGIFVITYIVLRLKEYRLWRWATQSISAKRCVIMWYQYCIWLIYLLEKDAWERKDMAKDNRLNKWEERWKAHHPQVSEQKLQAAEDLRQKAIYRKKGIEWDETQEALAFFREEYKYFFRELSFINRMKVRLGIRPDFLADMFRR